MSSIFLTSDWHLGHVNILFYCHRPFGNVVDMAEKFIENFNARVKPEDTTYHLGDFSLNRKYVAPVLKRLSGTHILIPGNHDECWAGRSKGLGLRQQYLEYGFSVIADSWALDIDGHHVLLDHMPYVDVDRHGEKYAKYRPKDMGLWLLHGHVHNTPENRVRHRQIDVGVDANHYTPVHLGEISTIIREAEANGT